MNQEVSGLEESAETQHLPKTGIKLVETFSEWMAPFLGVEQATSRLPVQPDLFVHGQFPS